MIAYTWDPPAKNHYNSIHSLKKVPIRNQYSLFSELLSQSLDSADSANVPVFKIGALESCFITIYNLKIVDPIFLGHPVQFKVIFTRILFQYRMF